MTIRNTRHAARVLAHLTRVSHAKLPQGATMGYMTNGLTFNTLREANVHRLPQFRNKRGSLSHPATQGAKPGSDWTPNDWYTAAAGEMGELGSLLKQVRRGDMTLEAARLLIAKEIADVVTYLDILSYQLDMDMGAVIMAKFNEVSRRVGANIYIDAEGWHYDRE